MPFLEKLIEHTKIYESPTSFWIWSGITAIAAILRDNVYLEEGKNKLYPNIYTLLVANSGGRKNNPVGLCEDIVKNVEVTKVISGRASIQGILDELAKAETSSKGKMPPKGGSGLWISPELTAGIVMDESAISVLTDIYDGKRDFKHILRHSPSFKIERLTFTALMASNEDMMKGFMNTRAVYGGFLGRTFVVTDAGEFRSAKPLFLSQEELNTIENEYNDILSHAHEIKKLRGIFKFSTSAKLMFEKWYTNFRETLRVGDKGGVASRVHTNIKKVSMSLAANNMSLIIEDEHVEKAMEMCLALMPNYRSFIMGTGKSTIADAGATIIKELFSAEDYKMTRKELLRTHWMDIGNVEDMDKVIQTLAESGILKVVPTAHEVTYQLSEDTLKRMQGVK